MLVIGLGKLDRIYRIVARHEYDCNLSDWLICETRSIARLRIPVCQAWTQLRILAVLSQCILDLKDDWWQE